MTLAEFKPTEPTPYKGWATAQQKKTRENKPYYYLQLMFDHHESAICLIWDNHTLYPQINELFHEAENIPVRFYGEWLVSNVMPDTKGDGFKLELSEYTPCEYVEPAVVNVEALKKRLRKQLSQLASPYKQVVHKLFEFEEVKAGFFDAPVTETSSHNYRGGLLAHTVRLIDLIEAIGPILNAQDFYAAPQRPLDLDLLKCAAFFHDIGKVLSYEMVEGAVQKTKMGELFEQSYLGAKWLNKALDDCDLNEDTRLFIELVSTSSQERLAYGALNMPRIKEAEAFHLIERLEMKMAHFDTLEKKPTENGFAKLFEKTVYLPPFLVVPDEDTDEN